MNTNTDETFIRTAPPLNRFVVKLGGPAPWEILTADDAREIADALQRHGDVYWVDSSWSNILRRYAVAVDAVDAMTHPERDMVTTDEELFF